MASPHDGLFKYVFGQPEHAASELRALFPAELSARFEWGSLRLEPASFVDEQLSARQADLLFSVRCDDHPAFVYVLLEHQSSNDPIMAFRLLRYLVRIWDAIVAQHPQCERLPAIVPVVLYHGSTRWAAPTEFGRMLDVDPVTMAHVGVHLPQFRFLLDDLSGVDDASLRARTLTPEAAAALMLLARARRNTSLIEALWRWADVLAQVASTAKGREALVAFWVYALRVGDMKPEDLHHLAVEIGPTANEAYMTAAQVLHERGKAEGRAEGKAEGKAEVLLRLLVLKFGVVSDGLRERIRKASVNELDVWTDRLIMASSMDEMLGGDEPT